MTFLFNAGQGGTQGKECVVCLKVAEDLMNCFTELQNKGNQIGETKTKNLLNFT